MRYFLFLLLGLPCAHAQVIEVNALSVWAPWTQGYKVQCTAQLLNASGNAIASQKATLGSVLFLQPMFSATFPGQKTSPMSVQAVRLSCVGADASTDTSATATHRLASAFVVPAGKPVTATYIPGMGTARLKLEAGTTKPPPALPIVPPPQLTQTGDCLKLGPDTFCLGGQHPSWPGFLELKQNGVVIGATNKAWIESGELRVMGATGKLEAWRNDNWVYL